MLRRTILDLAEKWAPNAILMEDKASGQSLLQDFREAALPLIARQPRGDKITRTAAITPMLEAGLVCFPDTTSWLAAFEEELLSFPHGAHDDQVDALSQYLIWLREKTHNRFRMRQL